MVAEEKKPQQNAAAQEGDSSSGSSSVAAAGVQQQQEEQPLARSHTEEQDAFDEPDDELEEFDVIGEDEAIVDLEIAQWDEDWDAAGWDDEDVNDDFIKRLQKELEAFKVHHLNKQYQTKVVN